jgi:hypothetical protein
VDVPSLYRLIIVDEGGDRISEAEAMLLIEKLREVETL